MTVDVEKIRRALSDIDARASEIWKEVAPLSEEEPAEAEAEPGLVQRFEIAKQWQSTVDVPVAEIVLPIPGGYSQIWLDMTIEMGEWHPELTDGIHGLFWLFEGDWDRTLGYAICRGPKRNRLSFLTKRGWGKGEAGQARARWEYRPGDEVALSAAFTRSGADLQVGALDPALDPVLSVFAGAQTKEPFGDAKDLTLWLGNPDDRHKGAFEVPSVGWIWKNVELSLWK